MEDMPPNKINKLSPRHKEGLQDYFMCVEELNSLCQEGLPRKIRQFDIRFRLACSLQISFDDELSYTKTESTKKTYRGLIQLNDLWFAYEGLFDLIKARGLIKVSGNKSDPFLEDTIEALGLNHITSLLGPTYCDQLLAENTKRNDLCNYIKYLALFATSKTQIKLLDRLKNKTKSGEPPTFSLWLALVYAIRNMYVHNTDTAKSGVKSYSTKIAVLSLSKVFMIDILLVISKRVLRSEISKYQ